MWWDSTDGKAGDCEVGSNPFGGLLTTKNWNFDLHQLDSVFHVLGLADPCYNHFEGYHSPMLQFSWAML